MCLGNRGGSGGNQLPAGQELFQKFATCGVLIDYQRRNSSEPAAKRRSRPLRTIDPESACEMERAACALTALHPDTAAHHIDQLGGNREPQTRSPIVSCR